MKLNSWRWEALLCILSLVFLSTSFLSVGVTISSSLSTGNVQTIVFSESVTITASATCATLLTASDANLIGTGATCAMSGGGTSGTDLIMTYGTGELDPSASNPLSFVSGEFTPNIGATEEFYRPVFISSQTQNGAVDILVFSEYLYAPSTSCSSLMTTTSAANLGTTGACTYYRCNITLKISYSSDKSGTNLLNLKASGFQPPITTGSTQFNRLGVKDSTLVSANSIGSVQTLIFSQSVTNASTASCGSYFNNSQYLGTSADCSFLSGNLVIKYGEFTSSINPYTLKFKGDGLSPFVKDSAGFSRPTLPSFVIQTDETLNKTHEFSADVILGTIVKNGRTTMNFLWKLYNYTTSIYNTLNPSDSTITTYNVNYMNLDPGEYNIKIYIKEESGVNDYFYLSRLIGKFIVLKQCEISCADSRVIWKLKADPGTCTNFVTGGNAYDTITTSQETLEDYHYLYATYQTGDDGGKNLTIDQSKCTGSFARTPSKCGADLKFPDSKVDNSTFPTPILQDHEAHKMSLNVTSESSYNTKWTCPSDFTTCCGNSDDCTVPISGGGLKVGSSYFFNAEVYRDCNSSVAWETDTFNTFFYSTKYTFTIASEGSVQRLSFDSNMDYAAGKTTCSDIIDTTNPDEELGTGATCKFTDSTTLSIKYGPDTTGSYAEYVLVLKNDGFSALTGTFGILRTKLPKFTISSTQPQANSNYYQDYSPTISLTTYKNGQNDMLITWAYTTYPGDTAPSITAPSDPTKYTVNYWEVAEGDYILTISLKEQAGVNDPFIYTKSIAFSVSNSCSISCEKVTFKFGNDVTSCTGNYVNGHNIEKDSLVLGSTPRPPSRMLSTPSTTYPLYATYQPGSQGGNPLSINASKCTGVPSLVENIQCGKTLKFPYISIGNNAPVMQSSKTALNMSAIVNSNGLTLGAGNDYELKWTCPASFTTCCSDGASFCVVPVDGGGLSIENLYQFSLKLYLTCKSSTIWDQITFKSFFYYDPPMFTIETAGYIQTLIFNTRMDYASGKSRCSDIINTETEYEEVGEGAVCVFTDSTHLQIQYGNKTSGPDRLSVLPAGFSPVLTGGERFNRPELPDLIFHKMPPRAVITGGDSVYLSTTGVTLSAVSSMNPENSNTNSSGLIYLWECFTDSERKNKCSGVADSDNMTCVVDGNILPVGIYYFTLRVQQRAGVLLDTAETTVTIIAPGLGPEVELEGLGAIKPGKNSSFSINFKDSKVNSLTATYKWTISPGVTDSFSTGAHYTILADTILPNINYTLSCLVTMLDNTTTTITTYLHSAHRVILGTLHATPLTGIALQTKFTFLANNFQPAIGTALLYQFAAKVEGKGTIPILLNMKFEISNTVTATLPVGRADEAYKVTVIVTAKNEDEMIGNSNVSMSVSPLSGGYSVEYIMNMINSGSEEEQIEALNMVAGMSVSGTGDTVEGTCGKCSKEYGSCNIETKKCVCAEGYTSLDCTLTAVEARDIEIVSKAIVDKIDELLQKPNLSSDQLLSLLSAASVCTESSSLGYEPANKVAENIESTLLSKLEEGLMDIERAGPVLMNLISNSMSGLHAERGANGSSEEVVVREKERMDNLEKVTGLVLGELAVGTEMIPIITDNFQITGTSNTGAKLGEQELTSGDGAPLVTLPAGLALGQEVILVSYIAIKTTHINTPILPLGDSVNLALSMLNGTSIYKSNLTHPLIIIFQKPSGSGKGECKYYDPNIEEYTDEGITLVSETDTTITCSIIHFSEFTILPLQETEDKAIQKSDEVSSEDDDDDDDDNNIYGINRVVFWIVISIVIMVTIVIIVVWIIDCIRKYVIYICIYIYIYIEKEKRWK